MAPLTKTQRNGLYIALEGGGVPVMNFTLETQSSMAHSEDRHPHELSVLTHLATGSFFTIERDLPGKFQFAAWLDGKTEAQQETLPGLDTSPFGPPAPSGKLPFSDLDTTPISFSDWEGMAGAAVFWAEIAERWAKAAEEYEAIPDYWAEASQSKQLLAEAHDSNTPFTAAEQAEISGQIKQVKDYITTTYELTGEQIAEVEERLDQAERASRHLGRKDWLTLFYGALFALVLPAILPPPAVEHILVMTLHGLGHLFGIGDGPPRLLHG